MDLSGNGYPSSGASGVRESGPAESGASVAGFVCGILSCVLNALFFTVPLGSVLGIIGIILCLSSLRYAKSKAGLTLCFLSFAILLVWLASVFVPFMLDPTFRWAG